MNRVYLIARQEFIKFVTRRGFLFTLMVVFGFLLLIVTGAGRISIDGARAPRSGLGR